MKTSPTPRSECSRGMTNGSAEVGAREQAEIRAAQNQLRNANISITRWY